MANFRFKHSRFHKEHNVCKVVIKGKTRLFRLKDKEAGKQVQ